MHKTEEQPDEQGCLQTFSQTELDSAIYEPLENVLLE